MLSRSTDTSASKKLLPIFSESTVPLNGLGEASALAMAATASERGIWAIHLPGEAAKGHYRVLLDLRKAAA